MTHCVVMGGWDGKRFRIYDSSQPLGIYDVEPATLISVAASMVKTPVNISTLQGIEREKLNVVVLKKGRTVSFLRR